ncbi:reverse transcriptase family protein [Aquibium microcysteis]|uniref:reverse transcriptase family protein n=1 Tax=Aquibium microcysteis TaxID=675281 RepID=UPI00165CFCCA|nr:reverse transcriptase family protein [Aquibium microcysteis]
MPTDRKRYALDQSPFYKLRNRRRLAELLGVSPAELRALCEQTDSLYSEFDVPKKTGGVRGVENPRRQLKMAQANIARLLGRIAPPDYLFCPVKGRCYVTNAAQHRGQRVVRCLDVRKYFPSTSSRRVFWFFRTVMRCEIDIAAVLARLACYQGHLPTGSPLSPIMAYFAHYDVWEAIAGICKKYGYRLTVYIDDVTISGRSLSPQVIWRIKREIHRSGLRYHKEKHFVDRPAEITGVIVDGDRLLVPNRQLKKVHQARQSLRAQISPDAEKKLREQLLGLQGQVAQIASVK